MKLVSIMLLTLGLMAGCLFADGARTPVYESMTINNSGHYYLTRNISVGTGSAIYIDGTDIVLDLNGYELSTTDAQAVIEILEGSQDITIRNGTLSLGTGGVYYSSDTSPLNIRVENLTARNHSGRGIYIRGAEFVEILHCHVYDVSGVGILINGQIDGFRGRFLGNRLHSTGGQGMYLIGLFSGRVQQNEVSFAGNTGISITANSLWTTPGSSNLIEDNAVYGSSMHGFLINSPSCIVRRNVASDNTFDGFYFMEATDCTVAENLSYNNTGAGFTINTGGVTLLDNNQSTSNGSLGVNFLSSASTIYRNNNLRNNFFQAISGTATDEGGNLI